MTSTAMWTLFASLCLSGLASAQQPRPLGTTPVPSAKDLEEERRFIAGVVDPQNTLDMIVGRPRVILLKATPFRTQIADESVMAARLLEPNGKQLTVLGTKPGITVLNLWFTDPADNKKDVILSYMVRVFPDPEAKDRLIAQLKQLEKEVNAAFPNSRARLTLVGSGVILSGQAHDIFDATRIPQVVK